ncbi:leucine-rich repeat and coiled-coil domain-containing protein 1-like [Xenopus tropicalis]|uniref:Leucine-rich repeat and coiled-coil domain-containing protein 1-like n=1 Tax=Xenopus tropicalis TaxID=8364 RepID=A0A8J0R421_XENTR|nr:leucine-rich repeat and coiled-coil domain-containing protein 1-like [Xenopus tropicalis]|eukprot:XP_004915214.1 PREDICTED: leucine-rich repeat and coiled-coil domain-containing protein 1-like [Xenopus tropicalis]
MSGIIELHTGDSVPCYESRDCPAGRCSSSTAVGKWQARPQGAKSYGQADPQTSCPNLEQTTLKARRDTDFTTESDFESAKDNRKGSTTRTPGCRKTSQASKHQKHQASQQSKGRTSVGSEPKQNVSRKQPLSKTQRKADIETSVSSG